MRYFMNLSYKGTNYHGWQIQRNAPSVQAELERALSTVLRLPTPVTGAGRTDTAYMPATIRPISTPLPSRRRKRSATN